LKVPDEDDESRRQRLFIGPDF